MLMKKIRFDSCKWPLAISLFWVLRESGLLLCVSLFPSRCFLDPL
jgi:hypothetical protein